MAFGINIGGSQSKGKQTVSMGPWAPQQPYLLRGFGRAQELLDQPAINPLQQEGFAGLQDVARTFDPRFYNDTAGFGLDQAGRSFGMARRNLGMGSNALRFLTDPSMLSPDSNPYLARYSDAVARPVIQNLTEKILPSIRSDAINAGQYGGSRQGIAEGIASRGATQAIADATAGLYSNAYGQGLNAMNTAAATVPGYTNAGTNVGNSFLNLGQAAPGVGASSLNLQRMPADILTEVGTDQQQLPWQQLLRYMQAVQGNYGQEGTTRTTGQTVGISGSFGSPQFFGGR